MFYWAIIFVFWLRMTINKKMLLYEFEPEISVLRSNCFTNSATTTVLFDKNWLIKYMGVPAWVNWYQVLVALNV